MIILQRQDRQFTVFKGLITFIFNILVKINYQKCIVFKNLQWLLAQLVSFISLFTFYCRYIEIKKGIC